MKSLSFEQKLLQVQRELLQFAFILTADKEKAKDLMQDTSLRAWTKEKTLKCNTNFKNWMYTLMRNVFLNNYRQAVYQNERFQQSIDSYRLELPSDTFFSTEEANNWKEIYQIIDNLPPIYKKTFKMYVAGFKYREIAEKLNLPTGTVKSRIHKTRQYLQKELKDYH